MSFEFNWSVLDNEQLRNNILNKLNQLIQDKLPKLPDNNNNNDNDNNTKVDYTTFNLLLTTLDQKILSIHFGNTKPELKLINLDVNANNLQSGSITFEINYNNEKNNDNNNDEAHITIQINAQGNPISAKTYLEYVRNSYMGILDSD